uniref:Ribonuclease 3-like n=1 Tax=Castor canadensis TaxID=51338 RepID=A0A8B7UYP0_CASCN|nr:ribonuclease 3-like [Castor canadensis]
MRNKIRCLVTRRAKTNFLPSSLPPSLLPFLPSSLPPSLTPCLSLCEVGRDSNCAILSDLLNSHYRINHNERLEFLGDAVVEFLTSVHLYYLFPSLEEGGLATYRTAIVQNQHLAMLAKKLELDRFMLYAHGPDLCRESDLRHAMANCFEALIGAVYLEGSLEEAKQLFGRLLFNDPHAMMLPVLTHHIRYHQCLMHLDKLIGYTFQDRCLLQLAMTHPSHHLNFGMNPDHARNSLSNCGIRQPKYGDRKVHHMHMRKKGINTLINIMSRLGQDDPTPSR